MTLFGILLEGLLSFVSPCVLPLVPLYMSYLSNGARSKDLYGKTEYKTLKVFITTLFFVLGISATFVILAISANLIKPLISKYTNIISIIGGTVLIFFGLHDIGLINISFLNREKRINVEIDKSNMNYLKAFLLGFLFSFAWTPCIGPMLSNALLLASTEPQGYLYILFYALGLVIPFLITGLFTSTILNFINRKKNILKYTTIVAGIIILCFGCYMIYNASKQIVSNNGNEVIVQTDDASETQENEYVKVPTSIFKDQDGNKINLYDYKGKYIFFNFITTWCGYCEEEIPVYEKFAKNYKDEVVCFYVMSDAANNEEGQIKQFSIDNKLDICIIDDENLELMSMCGIQSYPTTFVVGPDSTFLVYAIGAQSDFKPIYDAAQEEYGNR